MRRLCQQLRFRLNAPAAKIRICFDCFNLPTQVGDFQMLIDRITLTPWLVFQFSHDEFFDFFDLPLLLTGQFGFHADNVMFLSLAVNNKVVQITNNSCSIRNFHCLLQIEGIRDCFSLFSQFTQLLDIDAQVIFELTERDSAD